MPLQANRRSELNQRVSVEFYIMDLMRFKGSGCRALPATPYPTPLQKSRGAGWWQDMYVYTPPVGWGQKGKTSLYPP